MSSRSYCINVRIQTEKGAPICISLKEDFTLADFKRAMEQCFGNVDHLKVIVKGKQLNITDETDFNKKKHLITENTIIFLCMRMIGGGGLGVDFVDLSNAEGLKRREWSITAPIWRIATFGLCLEGKCNNNSCEAYQQQVIVRIGFGKFDLLKDPADTSNCPMCGEYVEPITCAFSHCRWRWHGKKVTKPGTRPEKVEKEWQIVDNAYHIFEESISGMTEWRELLIEVEQR